MTFPEDIITILYIILLGQGVIILGYIIAVLVDVKRSTQAISTVVEKTSTTVDKVVELVNFVESKVMSIVSLIDMIGSVPKTVMQSFFGQKHSGPTSSRKEVSEKVVRKRVI